MQEVCRYLGSNGSGEHTVLVTTRRSVFSPSVIFGLEPVNRVEMFIGGGEGEAPFRCISTGEKADPAKQRMIIEFLKERL